MKVLLSLNTSRVRMGGALLRAALVSGGEQAGTEARVEKAQFWRRLRHGR